jgi:hypothetical protein
LFERSLKWFLSINLGEAQDKGFELSEPKGRVFKAPGASPIDYKPVGSKTVLDKAKMGLDHIPVFQSAEVLQTKKPS